MDVLEHRWACVTQFRLHLEILVPSRHNLKKIVLSDYFGMFLEEWSQYKGFSEITAPLKIILITL